MDAKFIRTRRLYDMGTLNWVNLDKNIAVVCGYREFAGGCKCRMLNCLNNVIAVAYFKSQVIVCLAGLKKKMQTSCQ